MIPKGTTHEFWMALHAGAQKAADELGLGRQFAHLRELHPIYDQALRDIGEHAKRFFWTRPDLEGLTPKMRMMRIETEKQTLDAQVTATRAADGRFAEILDVAIGYSSKLRGLIAQHGDEARFFAHLRNTLQIADGETEQRPRQ